MIDLGGECADKLVAEVHVDERADLDDAHGGARVALAERDREAVVADDAVAPHLAQERVRRVLGRALRFGESAVAETRYLLGRGQGTLDRGQVE